MSVNARSLRYGVKGSCDDTFYLFCWLGLFYNQVFVGFKYFGYGISRNVSGRFGRYAILSVQFILLIESSLYCTIKV